MLRWGLLVLGLFSVNRVSAGEFNPVLNIGDVAPVWKNLPGVDGKLHSLADLKDKPVVVVVFTCNSCPYAVDYEDRLNALAKQHAGKSGKVAVVAINVNHVPEDSLAKMQSRAKAKGFQFAYVYDESQDIAREFGATRTPEFFVLNAKRKVIYMGAMDDNTEADKVTKTYLTSAIKATLAEKTPAIKETVAIGCNIRFLRKKRSR